MMLDMSTILFVLVRSDLERYQQLRCTISEFSVECLTTTSFSYLRQQACSSLKPNQFVSSKAKTCKYDFDA